MTIKESLFEDMHIFRNHFLKCDQQERYLFKKLLYRYKNQLSDQDFLKWFLIISKEE